MPRSRIPLRHASSALALATACAPMAALQAQAFDATPTVVNGTVSFDRTTPGLETVTIGSTRATIDWQLNDTSGADFISYLPSGHQATFINNPSTTSDFVVLNRVSGTNPETSITFDGAVISRIQQLSGASAPGGGVWFFSQGGIVVNATGSFDVGNLVLTTLPVIGGTSGNFYVGGAFSFDGVGNTGEIVTLAGSQITLSPQNSFVAIVAPRVQHNGNIDVNGSVALVAAEEADLFIDQGLFTIAVSTGTGAVQPNNAVLTVNGDITGPASNGGSDNHGIYAVAVPKNDAITMFISPSGQLGFDIAQGAGVENGVVVLSGGHNVSADTIFEFPVNATTVDLIVEGGEYTSRIEGRAYGRATAGAFGEDLLISADLSLKGLVGAQLLAGAGRNVTVDGDVLLSTDLIGVIDGGPSITAGLADIQAQAATSSVDISGDVTLTSNVIGNPNSGTGPTGNATGGQTALFASGGSINIGGSFTAAANGTAGAATGTGTQAGNGTGGSVSLFTPVDFGGSITIGGDVTMNANGTGGITLGGGNGAGGLGTGGLINVSPRGNGSITITGLVSGAVAGTGGSAIESGDGGDGIGGVINVGSGTGTLTITGDVFVSAEGNGGFVAIQGGTGTGGDGTGGTARINTYETGAVVDITGDVSVSAFGNGGATAGTGTAGVGTGGQAMVIAGNGGDISIEGNAFVDSSGTGGGVLFTNAGIGGDGTGGRAQLLAFQAGSSLTISGDAFLTASGQGGNGGGTGTGIGGEGTGMLAEIFAQDGSVEIGGDALLDAGGFGGQGVQAGAGIAGFEPDDGGDILGAQIAAQRGSVTIGGQTQLLAIGGGGNAYDGTGGDGGAGSGGTASVFALSGTSGSTVALGELVTFATGIGGNGGAGVAGQTGGFGGNATGGRSVVVAQSANGTITADSLNLSATAFGGSGADGGASQLGSGGLGGRGGDARGGFVQAGTVSGQPLVDPLTGSATFGTVEMATDAVGGAGGDGGSGITTQGNGGSGGQGGFLATDTTPGAGVALIARGSVVTVGQASGTSNGQGGAGGAGNIAGLGGAGVAGSVYVASTPHFETNAAATLNAGDIIMTAIATGGTGSTTGGSTAGYAGVFVDRSTATIDSISAFTNGATPLDGTLLLSQLVARDGTLSVLGDVTMTTASDFALEATGGTIDIGGDFALDITGDIIPTLAGTPNTDPGEILVGGLVDLRATGDFGNADTIAAAEILRIEAGGDIDGGDLVTEGNILVLGAGDILLGDLEAVEQVEVRGLGLLDIGDVASGSDIEFETDGAVNAGALVAGDAVSVLAGSSLIIESAEAGITNPSNDPEATYKIGLSAGGAVVTGALAARSDIGAVSTNATISTGSVASAEGVFVALAATSIQTGSIATSNADGVYLANASMLGLLGEDFDPAPLFAADPVAAGGAISIGAVVTGRLIAATTNAFTGGAIDADTSVRIESGTLASFDGRVTAPLIRVRSGDIAIGANGSLGDDTTTLLELTGLGQNLFVGTDGTGWTLSATEAQKLRGQEIALLAANNVATITIGSVELNGSGGTGTANLVGETGRMRFQTGGTIRVNGALRYTNMVSGNRVGMTAGRIEVITDTGSIALLGSDSNPGGLFDAAANNIWVVRASLIDQLVADPRFSGRDALLSAASTAPRPEGYLQAGRMTLGVRNTLLVQNSGTAETAGGFTVGAGGMTITALATEGQTTPVDILAFGRARTSSGTFLTNRDIRPAIEAVNGQGGPGFTTTSAVNACLLANQSCVVTPPPPPPPPEEEEEEEEVIEMAVQIAPEVQGLIDGPLGADAETVTAVPDVRLQMVIDTSTVTTAPLIEEPVTSGGNPSLWGGEEGQ